MLRLVKDLLGSHLLPAIEAVFGVAPSTAQIASRKAHEYARHTSVGGLSLKRFVNFSDLHEKQLLAPGKS
jgi:hypothetical protein